ncbi:MAG: NAD(+)/NADH kinase [Bacillota bacterium]|nr:NAD(+)/NADH kinase [Bacillota bacterium]
MKCAGIVTNTQKDKSLSATKTLISELERFGFDICLSETLEKKLGIQNKTKKNIYDQDILFVLGGDGTIISQAVALFQSGSKTPIAGVNTGKIGFLTEIEKAEIPKSVEKISAGNFYIEKRLMLCAETGGKRYYALNEFGIVRKASAHLIDVQLFVDDFLIGKFSCDGMIVSSPSGSTAYSFSAGGPIISPVARCAVITPICAYSLNPRSIVIDSGSSVRIKALDFTENSMMIADGKTVGDACYKTDVVIRCIEECVNFVRFTDHNFYTKLHKKLVKHTF